MRIKASIQSFRELEIDISRKSSIHDLKKKLCKKIGIEPELTKLLIDGKILEEGKKVSDSLSDSDKIEVDYIWSRQLTLWGVEGQKHIRNSTTFIAGAGALGNEAAKNLSMLGIKRLIIVDNDKVELSNINRMIFFDREDVGRPKARVLAEKINKKFPYVEVWASDGSLENVPINYYLKSDLIMSCLDNIMTRIFLTDISRKYNIPIVDGGISGYHARVQTYVPPNGPCLICLFSIDRYGQIIGLRNPCDAPLEEIKIPSFPTTISLTSSIQTQEALKILLGHDHFKKNKEWPEKFGKPLEGIWLADLSYNKYSIMDIKKNNDCFICGKNGIGKDPVSFGEFRLKGLKDSTTALIRQIEKLLGESIEEILVTDSDGLLKQIIKDRKLSDYDIGEGDYQAMLKIVDEHKELIIKIV